jgi:diguanylate cyclase (GGDEF)-like protein
MSGAHTDFSELHWMMDMLQSIDVGVLVLDRDYRIQLWNSFMENHSGLSPGSVIGRELFELFPDIPQGWFRRKAEAVLTLKTRAFTTWEQRPYLVRFKNYRPITGLAEFMYQNVTLIPLAAVDGTVGHLGVILYDVTDVAVGQRELEAANRQLAELSRTDRLTGLYNRGYWEEGLVREFARVRRSQRPSSLVMFDIDHFKKVNDTYGHPTGDAVIRHVASVLRAAVRTTDLPGRYGGEEFVVMLADTAARDALHVAERLRATVAAQPAEHDGQRVAYTISLGVAQCGTEMADHKAWIGAADAALYASKHGGRNRATLYEPPATPSAAGA